MRSKLQTLADAPSAIEARLSVGAWYAEGNSADVAAEVLSRPERFDDLFECLLSSAVGVAKRAAQALEIVSRQRPDLFQEYKEVLFHELERQHWFVQYRLCLILPRLRLNAYDIERAAELFQTLLEGSQNALCVNALDGLTELALLDPTRKEETLWLIEAKMRHGTPAMKARGRRLLARLRAATRAA